MAQDDLQARQPLQAGHLDIGQLQQVEHGDPGHPHHVRGDHQGQGQRRQEGRLQVLGQARRGRDIGDGREQRELHRQQQDEDVADEELGQRHRGQGNHIDHAIEDRVLVERREQAQEQRQGHRDQGRVGGQEEGVEQPLADQLGHRPAIGQRDAEVAAQAAQQPVEVTRERGLVQPQFMPQRGQRLWRGGLAEELLGHVAG
ncbi:hypothetical protein FQZ97_1021930 [compost metagenome]